MKLFLFEFATCGEKIDDAITVEGLGMFKAAFDSFRKYYEVVGFVRPEFTGIFPFQSGSMESMENYLEESDAFLIVAPEDDFILFNLTKKAEKYGENLGSSSGAIAVTSDKWKLYQKLRGKVQVPETSLKPLTDKFVVKPRTACAGTGIGFADEVGYTEEIPEGYIAQEFIEGRDLSVSLTVGDEIRCVSVNEQLLNGFSYAGSVVPARIGVEGRKEVVEEAIRAVECVKGLKGYVGVDVVYSDQPYVIEINARLTTPVVAFEKAYGLGVADFLKGKRANVEKRQLVRKGKGLKNYYVKAGKYSLEIVDF